MAARRWWTLVAGAAALLVVVGVAGFRDRAAPAGADTELVVRVERSEATSRPARLAATSPKAHGAPGLARGPRQQLYGRVESIGATPIAGASVCVVDSARASAPDCVLSDIAGRFELDRPEAASATLHVAAAGFQPLHRRLESPPDEELILALLDGGVHVTGTVRDVLGGALAGAVVMATSHLEEDVAIALSSSDGTFRLDLPAGPILITAEAEGYSALPSAVSAPVSGLVIQMAPASSLGGRVLTAGSRTPVAGVTISATATTWPSRPLRSLRSSADGSFRLTQLSAGVYTLLATSDRFRGEVREVTLGLAETRSEIEILVESAVALEGLVRVEGQPCEQAWVSLTGPVEPWTTMTGQDSVRAEGLRPGDYQVAVECPGAMPLQEALHVGAESLQRSWELQRGLRVHGSAKRTSGVPLPGIRIDVDPVGDGRTVSCLTDEQGKFSCSGLPPGEFECSIAGATLPLGAPVRVSLPADAHTELELRAEASGSIRVRLENSAQLELEAVALFVHRERMPPIFGHLIADELVFGPLPLGTYEIRGGAPSSAMTVELVHDGQERVVSWNAAPHQLSGRVVDAAGMPVPDAWVKVESAATYGASASNPVVSDDSGAFSIPGLLPGAYRVSAISGARQAQVDATSNGAEVLVRLPP